MNTKVLVLMLAAVALFLVGTAQAGVIGHYTFDNTYSAEVGPDGIPHGTPTFVAGRFGDALNLDGTAEQDHVRLGTSSDYNFGSDIDFSVSVWVRTTGWEQDAAIISNKDWNSGGNVGWAICGQWGGGYGEWQWNYRGATGGRVDYDDGAIINDGLWHHLCVTHDRDGYAKFYFDGAYQDRRNIADSTGTIDAGYPTVVGTGGREGQIWPYWFPGTVDEVVICDRLLSDTQVQELFNGVVPTWPKASNPRPADGTMINQTYVLLGWDPGDFAATANGHRVYISTNFDDVDNRRPAADRGRISNPYYYESNLILGATYYWCVDEYNDVHPDSPWRGDIWSFWLPSKKAYNPDPPDGAEFIDPNVTLSWTAGWEAVLHTVYIGTDFDDVNTATGGTAQPGTTYTPGPLAFDTRYYWRVDEFDGTETYKGDIWNFKTIVNIPITDPNHVGWWKFDEGRGTIAFDWSGYRNDGTLRNDPEWVEGIIDGALYLDGDDYVTMDAVADDITSNDVTLSGWVKSDGDDGDWFSCNTGDGGNVALFAIVGGQAAMYDVGAYEGHSSTLVDDNEWHMLTYVRSGSTGYVYVDGIREGMHTADFSLSPTDRWSIGQEWDGGTPSDFLIGYVDDCHIFNKPLTDAEIVQLMRGDTRLAWNPKPAHRSTTDIEHATPLTWSPGDFAIQHDVYFGTDESAVSDADRATPGIYRGVQSLGSESYTPPEGVEFGGNYYWRIDEINNDATTTKGRIWNFRVADYLIVDNFEDYNDISNRIFWTWRGGYGFTGYCGNGTGAIIGHASPPFAEQTVVHQGRQSLPYYYDNTRTGFNACSQPITFAYSEAGAATTGPNSLDISPDWTRYGVKAMSIWYRAAYPAPGSFTAGPPLWTITASGADIWGLEDEFHYAYRMLNGNGSIIARVQRVDNTHGWAKAGVMIRNTLETYSQHAMVVMTPNNGVAFQNRPTMGGSSLNVNIGGYIVPHWVRLDRNGSTFTAYHANDVGGAPDRWSPIGDPCNIMMDTNVFIGLCLTSHVPDVVCTAEFTDVSTSGAVSGPWQGRDIGIVNSNYQQPMYAVLQDNFSREAVVYNPDANATTTTTWMEWNIALSDFTADNPLLNLTNIQKVSIGFGTRGNTMPIADCNGLMYIDDIRLYRPRFIPGLLPPWPEDFVYDGLIDYQDLAALLGYWLLAATEPSEGELAGWWKFDGNANDSSVHAIHGTPVGNPQYVAGRINDALAIDGDDHIVLGTANDLNFGDSTDFSVSLWVNTTGWQNDAAIISNKDWNSGSNTGWAIAGQSGGSGSWQWNFKGATGGRRDYDPTGPTLSDGQWHHLCVTHDRDGYARFYFDGEYQAEVDISGSTGSIDSGYPTVVGTDGAEGAVWPSWFVGQIDDVRIYAKVLTKAEVLYLAGTEVPVDLNGDQQVNLEDYAFLAAKWLKVQVWPEDP